MRLQTLATQPIGISTDTMGPETITNGSGLTDSGGCTEHEARELVYGFAPLPPGEAIQITPGICTPRFGAGQNAPDSCRAGRRLNKIMGKIVNYAIRLA